MYRGQLNYDWKIKMVQGTVEIILKDYFFQLLVKLKPQELCFKGQ